jgi:hypothetical protein
MPQITIAQGLPAAERDRQILQAFSTFGAMPETDFPAHVRPAIWMLRHQGYLVRAGSLYSITPAGLVRLDELNAALNPPPPEEPSP